MALPQVGLEAVIAGLPGFEAGARTITKAYDDIERKGANVAKASSSLSSSISSLASPFTSIGQSVLNFGAIAGGAALLGVGALTAGIGALGAMALGEIAKFERMSLSIQNLVAREISQGKVVEQQAQARIQLTQKEVAELEKLKSGLDNEANDRDILTARIQEQKQTIIDLTAKYGENGLEVIKERAELQGMELNLADLNSEIDTHNKRISELTSKNGQLTTILQKVRVGQMSITEAMELASPRAQELIKWIQLLAIQSPFNSEDIQMAFQTALAYGFTSEQAQRLTEAEVDFIAATGKSAQAADLIALALGQIQARGKLSAQELRQLSEQGVGVNKILEDMGFTLDDVTNGLVPVDKFIEAVIKDMEVFKGAAKDQATTFAGLITSLGEIKSVALREFFTGTFKSIQPYLAQFVDFLTKAAFETGSIKEMGNAIGEVVGGGLAKIAEWITIISELGAGGGLSVLNEIFGPAIFPLWRELSDLVSQISLSFSGVGTSLINLMPSFSQLSAIILPAITTALAFVNDNFESFKGALMGVGAVVGAGVFAAIVAGILSLVTPISLIVAGAALLGAAWVGNWGGIQEKTFAVWAVVQPILQQVYDWLSINIPIAVQFLADAWSNVLLPALTVVWNWLSTVWFPLQVQWYNFLGVTLVEAITSLSSYWTNTLLPAITAVSSYLSTNVVPLFQSFNNFLIAVFNKTIQAAAGLWQNILYPALQKVWDIIANNLQPTFTTLSDFISNSITPRLDKLGGETFPMLNKALETVTRWIKEATNLFKAMANAVNNFQLPEVLQEHSPSPFALSLIHIADAADKANISLTNLSNISQPKMFDKLFKINRDILSPQAIGKYARQQVEHYQENRMFDDARGQLIRETLENIFKTNSQEILKSAKPAQALQKKLFEALPRYRGANITKNMMVGSANTFMEWVLLGIEKAQDKLQDMIIKGSKAALQMAGQLNQFSGAQAEYLNSQIQILQDFITSGKDSLDFNGKIITAADAQEILNQKLQEQKDIQDDILKIKEQESKLQFLEQQLSLIEMVKNAGLNVRDVLGGITFGLNASIPDMLTATNNVIQAIIEQVDSDLSSITQVGMAIGNSLSEGVVEALGIASPSKVMQWIAKQTTSGFVDEMLAQAPKLVSAIQNTIVVPAGQLMSGIGSNTSNVVNNNFNMNVSALSSPQAVMQQYQVMRAMV